MNKEALEHEQSDMTLGVQVISLSLCPTASGMTKEASGAVRGVVAVERQRHGERCLAQVQPAAKSTRKK